MKRKSYAEAQAEENGGYVYNWPNILHNIEHGLFTEKEADEWQRAALSWVTCACGNQCADIPRYDPQGMPPGQPRDEWLRYLGTNFFEGIKRGLRGDNSAVTRAREVLFAIEQRSAEILRDMEK